MEDYLLIAVDGQNRIAVRFASLELYFKELQKIHSVTHEQLKKDVIQFVSGALILGSRQDEQQTILFKLIYANAALRVNCEVSSVGAARVAIFPDAASIPDELLAIQNLSVATLSQRNEIYESHVEGKSVGDVFCEFLRQSQQTDSLVFLPDLKISAVHKYVLWVERLPGTSDSDWQALTSNLTHACWSEILNETDPDQIMQKILPDGFRILAITHPKFVCSCSRERVLSSLTVLTEQDLAEIFMDGNGIHTRCDYCHTEYQILDDEIRHLLKMPKQMQ